MKLFLAATAFSFLTAITLPLGAQTITVAPSACHALSAHTAADDVAYQPGVDVDGGAVAPADLSAAGQLNFDADHEYWLPIEVPLENILNIAAGDTLNAVRSSNIETGTVTVKNGQAYFNGAPLSDAESHAIASEYQKQQADAAR